MKGYIKLHDKNIGFGFVEGDNGKEYYTRFDGLSSEERSKAEIGMPISFDLEEGLRGEEAIKVKLLNFQR